MKRLSIVGTPFFLGRHRQLAEALRRHVEDVNEVPITEKLITAKVAFLLRDGMLGRLRTPFRKCAKSRMQVFSKKPSTFAQLSRAAVRQITLRQPAPELVLQIFSMFSPAEATNVPYAHYIDITMAMAKRKWPAWAPFDSESEYQKWIELEGVTYRGAVRVFTFSKATRRSIIEDYGVPAEQVVAVGAAGYYKEVASDERTYGNQAIIFNGSDFERKGGDRVLAAFSIVRKRFSKASLTIVGNVELKSSDGILVPGAMKREDLFSVFNKTDIVLAPTRLEGMPGFVLEAMSRGVVPVLSDADAMDEMITDGVEGFVVSPPTPEMLALRIGELFENQTLLRSMGSAARTRIAKDWNWDAVARSIMNSLPQSLPVK